MKMPPEPILILHHAIPAPGSCHHAESDAGVLDEVKIVSEALQMLKIPFRVSPVASFSALPEILRAAPEHLVFNLIEDFPGHTNDAMQVPAVCKAFGKECTGNESSSQTLALDKWRTKAVLQVAGLPVPVGALYPVGEKAEPDFPAPWIVKPLFADASEGIYPTSVVNHDPRTLAKAISRIHQDFKHPALVEQFFGTREINVALFQRGKRIETLPISEIEFRGFGRTRPRIVDYAAKWHTTSFEYKHTVRVVPAKLPSHVALKLRQAALKAWHVLGCRDYARVDFRLDEAGSFVILEVNPNPDISPESGFEAALKAAGIPYRDFVKALYVNAQDRLDAKRDDDTARNGGSNTLKSETKHHPLIRHSVAGDRNAILRFMKDTRFFHDGEIEVAREVLDEAIAKGPADHYQSFTLLDNGVPSGWICFGPTPCTQGTFDVYWIGVSALSQGRGFGRALLDHAEKMIRKRKGRQIIIETSGRSLYDSTRGFYLKTGYREVARVPEFYGSGDDRVIYSKRL
ncbi:MAG: GNAT family N-acetyltransferase [bacterium]